MSFKNLMWDLLESKIFPVPSNEILFNQFSDINPDFDILDGHKIRRQNHKNYLESFTEKPDILLVGEAAGPWGMRFSGIPFTSERQLIEKSLPFTGQKSGSSSSPHSENSATIFWKTMKKYHPRFYVWNLIPFHPHKPDEALSIRSPNKSEIDFFSKFLFDVQSLMEPGLIIAVGRKAGTALKQIGSRYIYVRHPAQAGATAFREGIMQILNNSL